MNLRRNLTFVHSRLVAPAVYPVLKQSCEWLRG